jgi:hypothetical protein
LILSISSCASITTNPGLGYARTGKKAEKISAQIGVPQSIILREGLDIAIRKFRKKHRI